MSSGAGNLNLSLRWSVCCGIPQAVGVLVPHPRSDLPPAKLNSVPPELDFVAPVLSLMVGEGVLDLMAGELCEGVGVVTVSRGGA
jgi:hypothetical protein